MDKPTEALAIGQRMRMLTLILSDQQYHKCARIAKELNIRGGMVTIARGTVNSAVLNLLGIKSQKKTVINFFIKKEKARETLDYLTEELRLNEPGSGIAFTTFITAAVGFPGRKTDEAQVAEGTAQTMEEESMFKKLTVIVDRGMAEDVMDIAREAGVRGGTIMHGRGAGAEFTAKLFGVEVEPEKELVLILTPDKLVGKVVEALARELELEKPGKGILFVEPIAETRGVFSETDAEDSK